MVFFKKYPLLFLNFICVQFFLLGMPKMVFSNSKVLDSFLDSAKHYELEKNFPVSAFYYIRANSEAIKNNDIKQSAMCLYSLGGIYEKQGKIKDAVESLEKSILKLELISNDILLAEVLCKTGYLYGQRGQAAKGLEYLFKSLNKLTKLRKTNLYAQVLSNIAIIYFYIDKFEKAEKYLKQAIIIRKQNNDINGLARCYGNIAMIYKMTKKDSLSLEYYSNALKICSDAKDLDCVSKAYNNLGVFYEDHNDSIRALGYYKQSFLLSQRNQLLETSLVSATNIGRIYLTINLDSAKRYAQLALEGSKVTKSPEDFSGVYDLLYRICEKKMDYKNALYYYKLYSNENDSVLSNSNEQIISNVELKNEFIKNETQRLINNEKSKAKWAIELQKKEFEKNIFLLMSISLVAFCILLFIYFKKARRNSQEISETNKQLIEINREKDALMGIVAHDLKTPISQIKGLVNLLNLTENVSDEQIEILKNLNKAISHGDVLIGELLELNEIENDSLNSNQKINLKEILQETISQFEIELKKKQLTLITNIDHEYYVMCRKDWLLRIFNNLLSNSIKFSPYNKLVEVKMELGVDNNYINIMFVDQGPGISSKEIPLLFKKFQRLSNKPTGDETSTGLGLYITKVIIDKCDAKINCTSIVGLGTTFTVSFKHIT